MSALIELTVEDDIAILRLNRPGKFNALTAEMVEQLGKAADCIDANPAIRAAVLTGAGEKAFCGGGDIEDWARLSPMAMGQEWVRQGFRVFDKLARLKAPLIAAINGHALGGGLELAGVADLRIAEEHACFALPETSIGVVPGWSGTQRLVRRFGARAVRRLALFGERIGAAEALALGIVDGIVPRGTALEASLERAKSLTSRAPIATMIVKQLINAAEGEEVEAVCEILAGALVATTGDLAEGVAAFRQKRSPTFNNR